VGGKETIKVDVRVMAATHCDLEKAIVDRRFREDLYYRLNVINLVLPALRERSEDILPMAEFLMKKHSPAGVQAPVITLDLKHAMMSYQWPGNVRELENFVRKMVIFRDAAALTRELHAKVTRRSPISNVLSDSQSRTMIAEESAALGAEPILEQVTKAKRHAETEAILAALNSTRWNRKQAAILLRIDYKALLYKMKKLGVEVKEDRSLGFPAGSEVPVRTVAASGE
jgi:two-component system response regulator AtoC